MRCSRCGALNPAGAAFCGSCGAALQAPPLAPRRRYGWDTALLAAVVGAAVGALVYFLVLKGDEAQAVRFDPNRADQLAHAALLSQPELPGGGWEITAIDQFNDDDTYPDIPVCSSINSRTKAIDRDFKLVEQRAGRAQIEFSRSSPSPIDTSVLIEIDIYRPDTNVGGALKAADTLFGGDDYLRCLEGALGGGDSSASSVLGRRVSAGTTPPANGSAHAFEFELSAPPATLVFRLELYAWRYGNADFTLLVAGPRQELTIDLVVTLVSRSQTALDDTAKGKRADNQGRAATSVPQPTAASSTVTVTAATATSVATRPATTPAATATAVSGPTWTPVAGTTASAELKTALENLGKIRTFKADYTASTGDKAKIEGVLPDKRREIRTLSSGGTLEIVFVPPSQYKNLPGGWRKESIVDGNFFAFSFDDLVSRYTTGAVTKGSTATVNGKTCQTYNAIAAGLPGVKVEFCVADNIPVRVITTYPTPIGTPVTLIFTEFNGNVVINPPIP